MAHHSQNQEISNLCRVHIFFLSIGSKMGAGYIQRGCLWEAAGAADAMRQGMKVNCRAMQSCTNSAIWDMPRVVRACPKSVGAMRSDFL
jgi:hypothetical protein